MSRGTVVIRDEYITTIVSQCLSDTSWGMLHAVIGDEYRGVPRKETFGRRIWSTVTVPHDFSLSVHECVHKTKVTILEEVGTGATTRKAPLPADINDELFVIDVTKGMTIDVLRESAESNLIATISGLEWTDKRHGLQCGPHGRVSIRIMKNHGVIVHDR